MDARQYRSGLRLYTLQDWSLEASDFASLLVGCVYSSRLMLCSKYFALLYMELFNAGSAKTLEAGLQTPPSLGVTIFVEGQRR